MAGDRTGRAALPMYDWPEVRGETDALWHAITERLDGLDLPAPLSLSRHLSETESWNAADLVLAQTCGYPYVTRLRGRVGYVGTPIYKAPGCSDYRYSSKIIVRRDDPARQFTDLRGRRAAINNLDSLSGAIVLKALIAAIGEETGFFSETVSSGSHRQSLSLVAEGGADIAAIDAVCFALAGRHEPQTVSELRVIAETPLLPGLPLIAGPAIAATDLPAVCAAIGSAIADDLDAGTRDALLLAGIARPDEAVYDEIADLGETVRDLRLA
ncbi:MAG: PhnD/SsuA/transferrin family substrate-binding protein [Hyphomicrobiales bacterium]|nr:PhnD/SsuA/transferrin family substrate-binding protein [Hyphomicrobiales bacterium]